MKLLIIVILTGVGLFQTFFYLRLKKTFHSWPVVAAEITHSRLLNQLDAKGRNVLEAIIYFKYSFRGEEYEANTPALRGYDFFPSFEYERGLVNKYPRGEIVNVRVHPDAPDVAYLEVAPFSKISAILAPLGLSLLVAYYLWRRGYFP